MEEAIVGWKDLERTLGKAMGVRQRALQARKDELIALGVIFPVRSGRWKTIRYVSFPSLIVKFLRYHGLDRVKPIYPVRVPKGGKPGRKPKGKVEYEVIIKPRQEGIIQKLIKEGRI